MEEIIVSDFEDTSRTWAVVIDTDTYAGNFERQLTAFCTGHVGECNVGQELAAKFDAEVGDGTEDDPFLADDETEEDVPMITTLADEYGHYRPCAIHSNPRWFNDGLGGHYRIDDHPSEEEMVEIHYQKALEIAAKASLSGQALRIAETEERHAAMETVGRWPAYLSVAIYFDDRPTERQIAMIEERAQRFFAEGWHGARRGVLVNPIEAEPVHIEGFRLLEQHGVITEYPLG